MRGFYLILFVFLNFPLAAAWISGTVLDQDGVPIEGAVVSIQGTNLQVVTNSDGQYRFDKVPGSQIQVRVSSPEHLHLSQLVELSEGTHIEDFVLIQTYTSNIVVSADTLESTNLNSVAPVTVLSGDRLSKDQAPTLGETLQGTVGVHSSYFGPVASSPIIRGSDGPRVKVVQNGLDSSDVSRVGQDHAVAVDASTASHIEVLRGPATLQFGDGAIGGVVNVVDNRIPQNPPSEKLQGTIELRTETASDERFGKANLTGGAGSWAYHFSGFSRKTDDVEIPGFAEAEPETDAVPGILPNSDTDTQSYTAGLSWSGQNGFLGVSAQKLDNLYGVPGHSHHHEDEHSEKRRNEIPAMQAEESVFIDVGMERYQLRGKWFAPFRGIQTLSIDSGVTDYSHLEIENGATGTTFSSDTIENRVSLRHNAVKGWEGVFGIHQSQNDYEAVGEEAFTPPSKTQSLAVYFAEERSFKDIRLQVGARYNDSRITPNGVANIDLGHDEDHHSDSPLRNKSDDDHEERSFELSRQSFKSFSTSAGLNWSFASGQSLAFILTRAERAPSTPELFSAGAHLATSTYELGAVFDLDDDGDVLFLPDRVTTETSTGLDITLRKTSGNWGYSFSAFYNQVNDYFYQRNTGLTAAGGHGHDHEHPGKSGEEEEEGLPVLIFQQDDAKLYGFEFELQAQIHQHWSGRLFGDGVRTLLDTPENGSRNLPRQPPLRLGAEINFERDSWTADLGATWYDDQTRIAAFETETSGYTLVNAGISYRHKLSRFNIVGFVRGRNLGDEEARVHTSFIKNLAPLPGRSFLAGLRIEL